MMTPRSLITPLILAATLAGCTVGDRLSTAHDEYGRGLTVLHSGSESPFNGTPEIILVGQFNSVGRFERIDGVGGANAWNSFVAGGLSGFGIGAGTAGAGALLRPARFNDNSSTNIASTSAGGSASSQGGAGGGATSTGGAGGQGGASSATSNAAGGAGGQGGLGGAGGHGGQGGIGGSVAPGAVANTTTVSPTISSVNHNTATGGAATGGSVGPITNTLSQQQQQTQYQQQHAYANSNAEANAAANANATATAPGGSSTITRCNGRGSCAP